MKSRAKNKLNDKWSHHIDFCFCLTISDKKKRVKSRVSSYFMKTLVVSV